MLCLRRILCRVLLSACAIAPVAADAAAAPAAAPECIVPSKPGGGFDLTCKLAQKALPEAGLRLSYLPGGIGAVAWSSIQSQRRNEAQTLVAFSGGSLLNIALGKFGRTQLADMRWVAALGTDYGMIAVRADFPYKTLGELLAALKKDPTALTIGAGGTIGSQDWIKLALLARQAGIDPRALRMVAFEGGGEAFTALMAGHVQAVSGDVSEALLNLHGDGRGRIRVLGVLADARLPGELAAVPTAREQGFDVSWPVIRGVYMGPDVPEREVRKWAARFEHAMKSAEFAAARDALGLHPFSLTGRALEEYVARLAASYDRQARELGLLK